MHEEMARIICVRLLSRWGGASGLQTKLCQPVSSQSKTTHTSNDIEARSKNFHYCARDSSDCLIATSGSELLAAASRCNRASTARP